MNLSNTKCDFCNNFGHIKKICVYFQNLNNPIIPKNKYNILSTNEILSFLNNAIKFPITLHLTNNKSITLHNYIITHINNIIVNNKYDTYYDPTIFDIVTILYNCKSNEQIIDTIMRFKIFKSISYVEDNYNFNDIVKSLTDIGIINSTLKYETKRDNSPTIFINYIQIKQINNYIKILLPSAINQYIENIYINNYITLITTDIKLLIYKLYSDHFNIPVVNLKPIKHSFDIQYV